MEAARASPDAAATAARARRGGCEVNMRLLEFLLTERDQAGRRCSPGCFPGAGSLPSLGEALHEFRHPGAESVGRVHRTGGSRAPEAAPAAFRAQAAVVAAFRVLRKMRSQPASRTAGRG
ncbi:hypothetical protein NCCP1664_12960 [Zafaria cholistanensis]|uniref:Uncharacterized protein n=1 Tax=Zafaria cholistanensis TaxID=1682741 RepID=A0A5A7NQ33_9MICC|nr:hypothetical protein NCCP1664_12960 [Zafaria cholistanensis]